MRRHGISGPIEPSAGPAKPFYPYHALKDTLADARWCSPPLVALAVTVPAPLDAVADPTDATYVPRPEWYFLSLFQMLKYLPGPLEPVATMVIPGLVVGCLLALPFLGKTGSRRLRDRPVIAGMFLIIGLGVTGLTVMGLRDTPGHSASEGWSPLAVAGSEFVKDARCTGCHREGGAASEIVGLAMLKDPDWLLSHVRDPQIIAPGLREPPSGGMSIGQAQSVLSYTRRVRAGKPLPPPMDAGTRTASMHHRTLLRVVPHDRRRGQRRRARPDVRGTRARRQVAARLDLGARRNRRRRQHARVRFVLVGRADGGAGKVPGRPEVARDASYLARPRRAANPAAAMRPRTSVPGSGASTASIWRLANPR